MNLLIVISAVYSYYRYVAINIFSVYTDSEFKIQCRAKNCTQKDKYHFCDDIW